MGMFDTIIVPIELLPDITGPEHYLLKDELESEEPYGTLAMQTKDFDCMLDVIDMNEEGNLIRRSYGGDWYGSDMSRTDVTTFTGLINFYTLTGPSGPMSVGMFIEFQAKYVDGKLIEITRVYETD